jgi:hypothetical protein
LREIVEPYECHFLFVYDIEKDPHGEKTKTLIESLQMVIPKLQAQIPPVDAKFTAVSENNMTLWTLRRSIRWNFDYISNKTGGPVLDSRSSYPE